MSRYHFIFLSSFTVFVFFLTPNINTGDGGELVTASFFLGMAHPSSYPLYLMIGKTFTFLPLGNIAFRVAIISALFSALSLTLIYKFVRDLTTSNMAALFSVTTLLVSYSYFGQSVVAKFYPLNLFLILLILYLWANRLNNDRKTSDAWYTGEGIAYLTIFIAGLIMANHHTGIIILGPAFLAWVSTEVRAIKFKNVFIGAALFFSGFLINSYLFIRGGSNHFFNSAYVDSIGDFYDVLTRAVYKGGSTIDAAKNVFKGYSSFGDALKNFISILTVNFSTASYFLFLAGSIYLFKKNVKLAAFILLSFILYGPMLEKLTLGGGKNPEINYYIAAHQYFIPAFSIFAVTLGVGFCALENLLKKTNLKIISNFLPVIFALFPLVFLVSRATDSDFRTDFVPYQLAKDTYSIVPPDSVVMTFGDNASYEGWFIKLVGRYREDVCQISSGNQKSIFFMFQGCNKKIYGDIYPMFYTGKFFDMVPFILKKRFYGTDPIKETGAYKRYLSSKIISLDYLYLPQDVFVKDSGKRSGDMDAFFRERQLKADKLIDYSVCTSHFTDDFFSRQLCSIYAIHLANMAALYSDAEYRRTGENVKVQVRDMRSGYVQPLYTLAVTEKNRPYLEESAHILKFNQWPILYMREKE